MQRFAASDGSSTVPGSDWNAAWVATRLARSIDAPQGDGDSQPSQPHDSSGASFAQSRRSEGDHVAWQLSTRFDLRDVPGPVQDFLFGAWSEAIAHARLMGTQGASRARRYEDAIADLVWSVRPEALRRPAEVLQRVPPLLATLREGLSLLGSNEAAHETFFDELMKLHRPVLRVRRSREKRARPGDHPGGAAGDLSASEVAPAGAHSAADDGPAGFPSTEPSLPGIRGGTLFKVGEMVQLLVEGRSLRARLSWVSTEGAFYMFSAEGARHFSMTRRICERLLREGTLRRLT